MDKLAKEILSKTIKVDLQIIENNPDGIWGLTFKEALKAMQAYHEAKLKEKRLDYDRWLKGHREDTEPTEPPVLKTSQEWYDEYPIEILDPDGWDRNNFDFSWYEEKITFAEFDRRAMASTCMIKKP